MANKPIGAMGAGDYAQQMKGRGNPPRYRHLPLSEAWAKIDAEVADMKKKQDEALIQAEVARRLALMKAREPAEAAEMPFNKFGLGEMTKVLQILANLGDIEQSSNDGIILTINDVKVLVSKV